MFTCVVNLFIFALFRSGLQIVMLIIISPQTWYCGNPGASQTNYWLPSSAVLERYDITSHHILKNTVYGQLIHLSRSPCTKFAVEEIDWPAQSTDFIPIQLQLLGSRVMNMQLPNVIVSTYIWPYCVIITFCFFSVTNRKWPRPK